MRYPSRRVTRADVARAIKPLIWEVGNDALYGLCRKYPGHDNRGHIASKVWLIGRSYAASVERHKASDQGGEDFVGETLARRLQWKTLDNLLAPLPADRGAFAHHAEAAVEIHKALMDRMEPVLSRRVPSFTSKYLHFHCPNVFPIIDSRAVKAISLVTPDSRFIDTIAARELGCCVSHVLRSSALALR
jgi:hypothetical protein